jgi:hypothetical protein
VISDEVTFILSTRFKIFEPLSGFYGFLIEYNHHYRREKSFEHDLDKHILRAIKDNDKIQ